MKYPALLAFHATLLVSAAAETTKGDWRLDLLKEEGLDVSEESLQQSLKEFGSSPEGLEEAYRNLGAEEWPGKKDFGNSFRVSAKIGGTPGSASAWHLGIAIGKVRTLYHPDLRGGAFRFEEVGKKTYLTQNEDMGFTPKSNTKQWMSIDVHRLGNGKVKLDVTVEQGESGPGRFQRSLTVDATVIGDLNRLSLERSGREGGAAHFDDLTVDLRLP